MSQTLNCPNCGAPLDYQGSPDVTMECPYCKSSVIVPEELRFGWAQAGVLSQGKGLAAALGEVARLAGPLGEIARLAHSGKKIDAIKLYRQTFNVGLKEAKDAVDRIERGEPLTMANMTVEHVVGGEPAVMTEVTAELHDLARTVAEERRVKRGLFAVLASLVTPTVGTIIAIVACLGVFFLAFCGICLLLKSNPVYRAAMELVKNDPAVIELFGSPLRESLFVVGTTEGTLGGSETVNLQVAIRGPQARGTAHIWGMKEKDGTAQVFSIWIEIDGEEVLKYSDSEAEKGFQISPSAPPRYLPPTPIPFASAVLQFGGEGIGPGWFQDARSIALDGAGHIYVAEYEGGRVQVFDVNGTFITQWSAGDSATHIYDMTADRQGKVYVVTGEILRIEGATGRPLGKLTPPEGRFWFEHIALLPDGELIAMDGSGNLVRFDMEGNVTQVLRDVIRSVIGNSESIRDLAVDGLGNIFIAGVFEPTIFKFTPEGQSVDRFGSEGDAPGQFSGTIGALAVDHQGRIYVADFDGIKVFDATGNYLGMFEVEGVVFAMVFNDQNELFTVANVQQVTQFRINQP